MEKNNVSTAAGDLIYLVSCAVNCETPGKKICDEMDLKEVFALARRHSLTAAAAYALESAGIHSLDFREEKYKAVRRSSFLDIERVKVLAELEKHNIWYLPLKGIVLKGYYPKTVMREMSDNDILFDDEKCAEVKDIMEALGFECTQYGVSNHDVYEKPLHLDFEMHKTLFDDSDERELSVYFKDIKKKLIKDAGNRCGYQMKDEDFYIFLICHLYKHYALCGTGLRSLLDIYVFNKRFADKLDRTYLCEEFNKIRLLEFERGISKLADKTFSFQTLTERELNELQFFIDSNTHGTLDNLMMQELKNDDSASAKQKYVLKRVFPSHNSLKRSHPFVYRHKAIYPFFLLYRPFRGLIMNRKLVFSEIKRLKKYKKKEAAGKYNSQDNAKRK